MKYEISKVLSVNIPDVGETVVTTDKEADFGQIIIRAVRGVKLVNVRLVNLGDKVELELWNDRKLHRVVRINHDEYAAKPIEGDVLEFLFA